MSDNRDLANVDALGIVGQDARRAVDSLGGPSLLFDPWSPEGQRRLTAGECPGYNVLSLVVKRAQRKARGRM